MLIRELNCMIINLNKSKLFLKDTPSDMTFDLLLLTSDEVIGAKS